RCVDYARPQPRARARLSRAGGAARCHPWHRRMRRNDLWSRLDQLDAVARVACYWLRLLLHLRQESQPDYGTTAGNARGNQVDPLEQTLTKADEGNKAPLA